MNKADKARLDSLAAWMRDKGATRVVLTDDRLEVDLGPPVAAAPVVRKQMTNEEIEKMDAAEYDRLQFAASGA